MADSMPVCPYCNAENVQDTVETEHRVFELTCCACRGRFLVAAGVRVQFNTKPIPGGKPSVWARSNRASCGYRRWYVAQTNTETIHLEYEVHLGWQVVTYTGEGNREVELVDRKAARLALRVQDKAPCQAYKQQFQGKRGP